MTASPGRPRVAVLFGGRSAEHDVSVLSATNVMRALDPARYEIVPVFVARDGRWLQSRFADGAPETPAEGTELALLPGGRGRMIALGPDGAPREVAAIDALFPMLHGLHGEDGSVQGLAATARVPLVGCGILGSATALDKDIAKRLFREAGIPAARAAAIRRGAIPGFGELKRLLGLPVFIKPARQGSSVGVSKVANEDDYRAALEEGFRHDDKLLAEEFVNGREIECSVLEQPDGGLFVSRAGEIVPAAAHGFYTYDAKYIDSDGAVLRVPAELPDGVEDELRALAARAFRALGCDGMARADFFVTADRRILVNELNTIPGFTDISMYSKAMAASGVGYADILDRLIAHAMARAARDL